MNRPHAAFLLACLAGPAMAGAPAMVNYQGQLRESGSPVSGARSMVFRVCSDATASCAASPVLRWQSAPASVLVSTGLFRTSFTPSLAAESDWETMDLWLEVEVAGVAFTPRERLAAVPYALDARLHMGKRYTTAASAPSSPVAGDLWMDDSANPGALKYFDGTAWTAASGGAASSVSTASVSGPWQTASYGDATVTDPKIVSMSASKLTGALPAIDGSALTGVTATTIGANAVTDANVAAGANIAKSKISGSGTWALSDLPALTTAQITSGKFGDDRVAITTGAVSGQWQTANYGDSTVTDPKIVSVSASKLTGALPAIDGSALTGVTATTIGANAVTDANVAAGANIAKSKISGSGTWALSDLPALTTAQITSGKFGDDRVAITTGAVSGQWQTASYGDATVTDPKIVSVSASKLTGALPAIDGSALTGVNVDLTSRLPTAGGTMTGTITIDGAVPALAAAAGTAGVSIATSAFITSGSFGVGTNVPKSKVQVAGGDVYISSAGTGLILKSAGGVCVKIAVNDLGSVLPAIVTCP